MRGDMSRPLRQGGNGQETAQGERKRHVRIRAVPPALAWGPADVPYPWESLLVVNPTTRADFTTSPNVRGKSSLAFPGTTTTQTAFPHWRRSSPCHEKWLW